MHCATDRASTISLLLEGTGRANRPPRHLWICKATDAPAERERQHCTKDGGRPVEKGRRCAWW